MKCEKVILNNYEEYYILLYWQDILFACFWQHLNNCYPCCDSPWKQLPVTCVTHTTKMVYDSDLASLTDTVASLYTKQK